MSPTPFVPAVPEAEVDALLQQPAQTRWRSAATHPSQGVTREWVRALAERRRATCDQDR